MKKNCPLLRSLLIATLVLLAAGCTRGAADPAMVERLQQLEDREAILELMAAYGATLDRRDFTAFGKLFAEDAGYGNGPGAAQGRAAIQAQLESIIGSNPSNLPAPNFHLFFNPSIHIEGDTARATSLGAYTAPDAASGSTRMVFFVSYEDWLVKRDGRWLFQRRVTGSGTPP
ncbi:MAG TPA: nuclear transport factor 2 family protein [Steroidobacteraceae bacterium]|nr:nuclear transport factor 2 family protein [Steroidobacteraceae bacterium]